MNEVKYAPYLFQITKWELRKLSRHYFVGGVIVGAMIRFAIGSVFF